MRVARVITGVGAVLVCGCAAPPSPPPAQANVTKTVPLILEKNEGERLVFRPWPGHPRPDEIIFLQAGTARVHVGDSVRVVHAGATVFIPADTRISVSNIGRDALGMVFIFSAPGFEDFMRAVSVREGENNVPLSNAEDGGIQRKHTHDVVYQ